MQVFIRALKLLLLLQVHFVFESSLQLPLELRHAVGPHVQEVLVDLEQLCLWLYRLFVRLLRFGLPRLQDAVGAEPVAGYNLLALMKSSASCRL